MAMPTFSYQLFQALSDPTRLRCLLLLEREGELCVCELTHALGVIQPKVSRHLGHLRDARVVVDRRQGLWVYYGLDPDLPGWARELLRVTGRGLASTEPFVSDRRALKRMPNRPGSRCCG